MFHSRQMRQSYPRLAVFAHPHLDKLTLDHWSSNQPPFE
ncbi:Uncharacterised protein [Vibrio cholerae]|nr:Uncharacterised protein [Vibrio cholerae]